MSEESLRAYIDETPNGWSVTVGCRILTYCDTVEEATEYCRSKGFISGFRNTRNHCG